jgi:hypothetical protein
VTGHGKVAHPSIEIYGEADDGTPFMATAQGVGAPGAQVARVVSVESISFHMPDLIEGIAIEEESFNAYKPYCDT